MSVPITNARFDLPDRSPVNVLRNDLIHYEVELEVTSEDERARRAYVRASMAFVDATVHYLKHMTYNFATQLIRPVQQHLGSNLLKCPVKAISQPITDGELALLRDELPSVRGSGEIDTTTVFLDFRRNVKFTLKSAGRIFDAQLDFDFATDTGWTALSESADIRNRLVHPKPGESMCISDKEMATIRTGYSWMALKELELTKAIQESALRIVAELAEWVVDFKPEYIAGLQAEIAAFEGLKMNLP